MPVSLEAELKAFEKDLSILLVRFMKICDAVEADEKGPPVEAAPAPPKFPARAPATDFGRAYA